MMNRFKKLTLKDIKEIIRILENCRDADRDNTCTVNFIRQEGLRIINKPKFYIHINTCI